MLLLQHAHSDGVLAFSESASCRSCGAIQEADGHGLLSLDERAAIVEPDDAPLSLDGEDAATRRFP